MNKNNLKIIKRDIEDYKLLLSKMKPKLLYDDIEYEWILNCAKLMASRPMEYCIETIMKILEDHISTSEINKQRYTEKSNKAGLVEYAEEFLLSLDTVILKKKFTRLIDIPSESPNNIDIAMEISKKKSELHVDKVLNFIGSVAGAWILTYPVKSIIKYENNLTPKGWATKEEDYIYILRRHLLISVNEWFR